MDDTEEGGDQHPADEPLTSRSELIAAAAIVIGAIIIIGGVLVFVGATGADNPGPSPTVSGSPSPTQRAFPIVPANTDEQAVHDLARRSITVIPEGTWAELYDDYTADFRARCPAEEFAQIGRDAATELGADLSLLGFKGLRELEVTGDTARAVIVGELRGQSEYEIEAFFRKEDGAWKIAPAPTSEGCNSFNRLTS
jgi:hypothetical protein